jgi:hypothetical protein
MLTVPTSKMRVGKVRLVMARRVSVQVGGWGNF